MFPAGFFGTGHRMGADKMALEGCQCGLSQSGDFTFDAADVGHNAANGQAGRNLFSEWYDSIHRSRDHHETCFAHRLFRCIRNRIAPGLVSQLQSHFRAPRPKDNTFGGTPRACRACDRGAEEAGCKNGELDGRRHAKRRRRVERGALFGHLHDVVELVSRDGLD